MSAERSAEIDAAARWWHRCQHDRTRCIHGDEGWHRMKVYALRWWKEAVVRRQACLDCGAALDRGPICTVTGSCRHEGEWPTPPARTDQ